MTDALVQSDEDEMRVRSIAQAHPLAFSLNRAQEDTIRRIVLRHGHSLARIVDEALGFYLGREYQLAWQHGVHPPADGRSLRRGKRWQPGRVRVKLIPLDPDQWDRIYEAVDRRGTGTGSYSLLVDDALGAWLPIRYGIPWPYQERLAREGTKSFSKARRR